MRVLHLSDTPLSGSPYRISELFQDHPDIESSHICWRPLVGVYRDYPFDVYGVTAQDDELRDLIKKADIIHYHNRWRRSEILRHLGIDPPNKPSVIQIHSPRESENFSEEVASGLPIACPAQYHPRQWPELSYIVPNVVDIYSHEYLHLPFEHERPIVSYAPSNTNARGWDCKSYHMLNPILKRMKYDREIDYQLIQSRPFREVLPLKAKANIGIDEISTGSYHLSALEYLAMGICCIDRVDEHTEKVLKDLTGCDKLPFIDANKDSFERVLRSIIKERKWRQLGFEARIWMQKYWNPEILCSHYMNMYKGLL